MESYQPVCPMRDLIGEMIGRRGVDWTLQVCQRFFDVSTAGDLLDLAIAVDTEFGL